MSENIKPKKTKYTCTYCGRDYVESKYYNSNSEFYSATGKIPFCKTCIENLYQQFYDKYKADGCLAPERKAIKRLCMIFDVYFTDEVYNSAMKKVAKEKDMNILPINQYMKLMQLFQYNRNKETYENTITQEEQAGITAPINVYGIEKIDDKIIQFFGAGFTDEDYVFLKREYEDWTARHECKTKAQEEVFKDICFNRLQNLKALRRGEDTKDITASFQKMLDSGKLQPKQNSGDTTADNQTFGTLIDKWENTRPLPEIDEELKDVDKIALYINIFFKGHLAKMMGLKNAFSNLYTKFMKKYTVEKPEYDNDENSEALFDAIFGGDLNDEQ